MPRTLRNPHRFRSWTLASDTRKIFFSDFVAGTARSEFRRRRTLCDETYFSLGMARIRGAFGGCCANTSDGNHGHSQRIRYIWCPQALRMNWSPSRSLPGLWVLVVGMKRLSQKPPMSILNWALSKIAATDVFLTHRHRGARTVALLDAPATAPYLAAMRAGNVSV